MYGMNVLVFDFYETMKPKKQKQNKISYKEQLKNKSLDEFEEEDKEE